VALEICGYGALLDGCAAKGDAGDEFFYKMLGH
jgi:hypothetical protein